MLHNLKANLFFVLFSDNNFFKYLTDIRKYAGRFQRSQEPLSLLILLFHTNMAVLWIILLIANASKYLPCLIVFDFQCMQFEISIRIMFFWWMTERCTQQYNSRYPNNFENSHRISVHTLGLALQGKKN